MFRKNQQRFRKCKGSIEHSVCLRTWVSPARSRRAVSVYTPRAVPRSPGCTWTEMVMLPATRRRLRLSPHITPHGRFRRGTRLGKDDHIVKWMKPTKPRSIDRKTYDALPEFLMVRESRIRIDRPGFRVRCLVIATTLLNADEYAKDDLAQAYRARWNERSSISTTAEAWPVRRTTGRLE